MRVATDIGGTFTDLVYVNDEGEIGVAKSHTTPPHFEKGVIDVIEKSEIDQTAIKTFIHGTTVIINALTERKGVKTGLITTKGFRDVLEIARGNRPDLFNVRYEKPVPFVERYLRQEVEERLNYKGEVLSPLNKEQLSAVINYFKEQKVEAIAVAYLHSYVNPVHEMETVELIKKLWPEAAVTASYEVTKEWREYERTSTTVLNSYVKPIAATYVNRLHNKLVENKTDSQNYIMQSNGGTTTFNSAKQTPINMVESGPVAGIYGAAVLGEILNEKNIIAFDIGGTTAKCSLINQGEVKVSTDYFIEKNERSAGYPIKVPVVDIVEIGNGGGSIAWIDGAGSLKVGPQSAGALPGPVAYGQGGTEPTTTDANLITGRLSPENFDYEVDLDKVKAAIKEKVADHFEMTVEEAALGIIRIANSNMLNALKLISVRKGHNPREFSLVAFGGGGSMHAPALAKELGVKKVIVPVASSVFSAWGMLMTDLRHDYIQTYIRRINELNPIELNKEWNSIEVQALKQYQEEGVSEEKVLFTRFADIRYLGQEHTVKVPVPNGEWSDETLKEVVKRFGDLHEQHYTFKLGGTPAEIVNLHLTAFGKVLKPKMKKINSINSNIQEAYKETRPVYFEEEGWVETKVYSRSLFGKGMEISGPAIVEEQSASTVIYPGQSLTVDEYGNLIIETGVE
ncbi:hydantoinase/oxoprolinase family protein [Cytobacillus oceanisediminis]|uniref:hydantoinase/oxoprolinase family protein n=1 Tax=Cytobacillus oceanisediminis TaxID=665099 RepID=UPI001C2196E9|nr:hydantoinase/oxoprolinase family protein [Cytobacillus oceanisediminis]MBU8769482.1 hydantoinase/oxoprolinase family protein [Cytobacillus oceanisediminis]MCM3392640.1 hydantoinase/oxoprolinase family protein [Cytobacillus oceanisediminis]